MKNRDNAYLLEEEEIHTHNISQFAYSESESAGFIHLYSCTLEISSLLCFLISTVLQEVIFCYLCRYGLCLASCSSTSLWPLLLFLPSPHLLYLRHIQAHLSRFVLQHLLYLQTGCFTSLGLCCDRTCVLNQGRLERNVS